MKREILEARGFKLCGSRALGTHTEASDWDFYGQYTVEAHVFLVSLGFVAKPHDEYQDSRHVVGIYEARDDDGAKIQVALEFDAVFRDKIMAALRDCEILREIDRDLHKRKDSHRRDWLWGEMYVAAGFDSDDFDDLTYERVKP